MHSALKSALSVSVCVALVAACDSKDAPVDAGVVTVVVPTEAPPTTASAIPSADTPASTAPAAGKGGGAVMPAATDAGAALAVDAGAATGQDCCCEAAGFPLQSVAMTDCGKTRKGQCVAKTRCGTDAGVAPAPATVKPDAGAASGGQTCCCATGNVKAVVGMSACTKGGAGKCVKAAECR